MQARSGPVTPTSHMPSDPLLTTLCQDLQTRHGAHTLLLYGSRADGSAGPDSDYDLAAFAPVERELRDARWVNGAYLDAFVYPDAVLGDTPGRDLLKLRGCRVLLQSDNAADALLRRIDALHAQGPAPLPPDEIATTRAWAHKMVLRARRGDAEGDYRRAWLLTALLEDHFTTRGQWFEGPKKALRWLAEHEPATHAAFCAALQPGASLDEIAALVLRVAGPLQD